MQNLKNIFEQYVNINYRIMDLAAIVQNPGMKITKQQLEEFKINSDNICAMINSNKDDVIRHYESLEGGNIALRDT